jgi:hypothetical protein
MTENQSAAIQRKPRQLRFLVRPGARLRALPAGTASTPINRPSPVDVPSEDGSDGCIYSGDVCQGTVPVIETIISRRLPSTLHWSRRTCCGHDEGNCVAFPADAARQPPMLPIPDVAPLIRASLASSIIRGQTPSSRRREIAAAVLILCSRETSAITGSPLRADGSVVMSIT